MVFLGPSVTRCLLHRHLYRSIPRRAFSSSLRVSAEPETKAGKKEPSPKQTQDRYNWNVNPFDGEITDEHTYVKLVDANELEKETKPPTGVKMLVRDFIEDSLYNPNYGYFPKQATIFNVKDSTFDFTSIRDSAEFQELVAQKYEAYGGDKSDGPGRQLWHTPTELFKPFYGRAIARCLVSEYLLKYFPYEDFVIYEIGAGNGTLAMDILNLLRDEHPDVYERTRYNIIEISESLVKIQKKKLAAEHPCVTFNHKSVFHWEKTEPSPCFFIAMEVIDNFAHDIVRYDLDTLKPYQGIVTIGKKGDFDIIYTPVTDPLISSFLHMRRELSHSPPINKLLLASDSLRRFYTQMPFAPNLSKTEYVPTRLLDLLRTLRTYFPRHRLIMSDFSSLPDTIPGANAPVVQTRFRNTTVPCTTLLVKQGFFDIFFPTDFERLRDMYEYVLDQPPPEPITAAGAKLGAGEAGGSGSPRMTPLMSTASSFSMGSQFFSSYQPANRRRPVDGMTSASGLPIGERRSSVFSHSQFLETYGELEKTRLRNGENPMLEFYKNVKFLF